MARVVLVLVALFAVLLLLKALRLVAARWLGASRRRPPAIEGEMARDPICGAWFDRRLAVTARRAGKPVEVCSDACRRRLEAG
ncbi:MAG: hypothetical protein ACM3SU_14990 [Acidobacteriota bacterium]